MDFTVAICTYNGAERLPLVLDPLQRQIDTEDIAWEVLVVDNNSKDSTAALIKEYQRIWPKTSVLRYCFEAAQGLAYARSRAVQEAEGKFVGFLDDDNSPSQNWIAAALRFGQIHPSAGAYGGRIRGKYECQPPPNFERIQGFLAVADRGDKKHLFNPDKLILPAGAGMVIRKQAWLESVPKKLVRTTRGGNDYEISLHLHKADWQIWYAPDLVIYHHIPSWRLDRQYLLSLSRVIGLCTCELRLINTSRWQKPLTMARVMLGGLRRALLHVTKYGKTVRTDLVTACELAFHLGTALSPFAYLGKKIPSYHLAKSPAIRTTARQH